MKDRQIDKHLDTIRQVCDMLLRCLHMPIVSFSVIEIKDAYQVSSICVPGMFLWNATHGRCVLPGFLEASTFYFYPRAGYHLLALLEDGLASPLLAQIVDGIRCLDWAWAFPESKIVDFYIFLPSCFCCYCAVVSQSESWPSG